MADPRRQLPSVEAILQVLTSENGAQLHRAAPDIVRSVLAEARSAVAGGAVAVSPAELAVRAGAALSRLEEPSLRRVINASGVILQTNLGRAPLSLGARRAMAEVADAYSNLEFDLDSGERGSRHEHVRELIRRATGAEDGLAVNNNAAALLMVLAVLAAGREVIVSRGQAVEIGGGFRIPDVLRQSGARLVEVGTTNRTYVADYVQAIGEATAAVLRVHASNFQVVGFTATPSLRELAQAAHEREVLLLDDLGSGCLVATERFGLVHEPTVQESIAAGVDLALFSGDKLLGGPQCGVIAGRADLVGELRRHPLARALRVDKLTIAALNATLLAYTNGTEANEIPIWRMLSAEREGLRRRALRWARAAGPTATVLPSETMVGGGALPGQGVPTWCAAIASPHPHVLSRLLRLGSPPIVGRIEDDRVLLDPRTVDPLDDRFVSAALSATRAESAIDPEARL